jgi:hypothetical protein
MDNEVHHLNTITMEISLSSKKKSLIFNLEVWDEDDILDAEASKFGFLKIKPDADATKILAKAKKREWRFSDDADSSGYYTVLPA